MDNLDCCIFCERFCFVAQEGTYYLMRMGKGTLWWMMVGFLCLCSCERSWESKKHLIFMKGGVFRVWLGSLCDMWGCSFQDMVPLMHLTLCSLSWPFLLRFFLLGRARHAFWFRIHLIHYSLTLSLYHFPFWFYASACFSVFVVQSSLVHFSNIYCHTERRRTIQGLVRIILYVLLLRFIPVPSCYSLSILFVHYTLLHYIKGSEDFLKKKKLNFCQFLFWVCLIFVLLILFYFLVYCLFRCWTWKPVVDRLVSSFFFLFD